MKPVTVLSRRSFASILAGAGASLSLPGRWAAAAAPDGAGAVNDMIAALQSSDALSFTVDMDFGAAAASQAAVKTPGKRARVVFQRPDTLFAVFGEGGGPDVQMLVQGGEATLFRLSLAAKTVLKLAPDNGAAFAVPGLFLPFMGLLSTDVEKDFFGGITSITPLAQGLPDQPEDTTLAAVMGGRFTGETWIAKSNGLPTRITGTWFGAKGDLAASAAVSFSGWSPEPPAAEAFAVKGLAEARAVDLGELGL